MKNLINRVNLALNGEQGGPSVETIIGISVALIIGAGFILFGKTAVGWIKKSSDSVNSLNSSITP